MLNKAMKLLFLMEGKGMKTWKILKAGHDVIAYVDVNEKDPRDTMYYALQLARKYFNDYTISGAQILSEKETKRKDVPIFTLYYPEHFTLEGINFILTSLCCALWTNKAYGFCQRIDDGSKGWIVTFNNKEDLKPIEIELPLK